MIKKIAKKLRTLKNMNYKWFFKYYKKRIRIYYAYSVSMLIGRKFWEVDIDGVKCKLSFFHTYQHLIAKQLHNDEHERAQLSLWKKQAQDLGKGIIFDFGGYTGVYGLIAGAVNHNARVVIFEPEPVNFKHIQNNIYINNLKNKTAMHEVVSDNSGPVYFKKVSGSSAGHIHDNADLSNPEEEYQIKSRTINKCLSNYLEIPILIKFDICGAEYDAFLAAKETLSKAKKISILLEYYPRAYNGKPKEDDKFWSYLRSLGFEIVFLQPRGDGMAEYYFIFKNRKN